MANFNIDYLVVAGGGGGGSGFDGGGGGAGGLLTSIAATPLPLTPNVIYTIEVGVGGTRTANSPGGNGGDSSINGSDITLISADGGGGGGGNTGGSSAGAAGGSGGGAGYGSSTTNFGAGTSGQGNNGGYGALNAGLYAAGGGGGGAGAPGGNATINVSGDGGDGLQNNITGANLYYAGGGGGGRDTRSSSYPNNGGGGGDGGGGSADQLGGTGNNGNNGVGGGGAGAGVPASVTIQLGGTGGSGVVILRYTTSDIASYTTTGITPTEDTTTVSGQTILSFTTVGTGTITFTTPPPTPLTRVTNPVTGFESSVEIGLKLPSGTNANQPSGTQGMIRNDTGETTGSSTSAIEHYNGTTWKYFAATESVDNPLFASQNFNTVLYNGDNATPRYVTGVGFAPDLVWIKNTNNSFFWHNLWDSIRGVYKGIFPNVTAIQDSYSSRGYLSDFKSDGFELTRGSTDAGNNNETGNEVVAWCFKAGGIINKSADFNGSSSIIDINSLANVLDAQNIVSTSFWFKSTSTSLSGLFSYRGSASSTVNMLVALNRSATGDIGLDSSTSSGFITLGNYNGGYNDGNWHHVVSVINYTTGAFNVYIDNTLRITGTNTSISKGVSNKVQLGANYSSQYLNGSIGQARVFDSALTSSQVTELYNETAADNSVLNYPQDAGCIAAYPLGENANDLSNTYNGTASNVTFGKPGYLTRNTEGTIESTVSANVAAGFSIVGYTGNGTAGSTVGHGLASTPEIVIVKRLSGGVENWAVYSAYSHPTAPQNYLLTLDNTSIAGLNSTRWNDTAPTNAVFSIGTSQAVNANTNTYIAYCWHSVPGYSKISSYVGNGNAVGTIVTLDFEPAWVMIKGVDEASSWLIIDNKRSPTNPASARLDADDSAAEYSGETIMDLNSDGFQLKTASAGKNGNGKTFIYMAFAAS